MYKTERKGPTILAENLGNLDTANISYCTVYTVQYYTI